MLSEEYKAWMNEPYDLEYVFKDIPSLVEGYSGIINQSSLARISGINESRNIPIRTYKQSNIVAN